MIVAYKNPLNAEKADVYREGTGDLVGTIQFIEQVDVVELGKKYPARRMPSQHSHSCPMCNNPLGMEYRVI